MKFIIQNDIFIIYTYYLMHAVDLIINMTLAWNKSQQFVKDAMGNTLSVNYL